MKDDDVSALTFDLGSAVHIPSDHPLQQQRRQQQQQRRQPQHHHHQQHRQPHEHETNDEFLTRLRRNFDELGVRGEDDPSGSDPRAHDAHDWASLPPSDPRVLTGPLALIEETDDQVGHDGRDTRLLMADLLQEGMDGEDGADKKLKTEKKKSKKSHKSRGSKGSKRSADRSSSRKRSGKSSSSKDKRGDKDRERDKEERRAKRKAKRAAMAAAAATAAEENRSDAVDEFQFPLKEIRLPRPPSPSCSSGSGAASAASNTNAERRSSFSMASTAETAESTHSRSGQLNNLRSEKQLPDHGDDLAAATARDLNNHDDDGENDSTARLDHESLSRLSYFTEHTHDSSHFSHSRQQYPYQQQRRRKQSRTLSQHSLSQSQRSLSQQSQSQQHAFHQSFGHASHSTHGGLSYNTRSTTTTSNSNAITITHGDLLHLRQSVAQSKSELAQVLQIKHRLESEIQTIQDELSDFEKWHHERKVELRSGTEEMERLKFFLDKMESENARLRRALGDMEEREDEERLDSVLDSMEEKMSRLRSGGSGAGRGSGRGAGEWGSKSTSKGGAGVGFGRKSSLGSFGGGASRKAYAVFGKRDSAGKTTGTSEGNAMEAKVCPGIYSKRSSV
ncbi:hypothetical protein ACHAXS_001681 [Conticribra weissflogii]